jgi:hypothetical protein
MRRQLTRTLASLVVWPSSFMNTSHFHDEWTCREHWTHLKSQQLLPFSRGSKTTPSPNSTKPYQSSLCSCSNLNLKSGIANDIVRAYFSTYVLHERYNTESSHVRDGVDHRYRRPTLRSASQDSPMRALRTVR